MPINLLFAHISWITFTLPCDQPPRELILSPSHHHHQKKRLNPHCQYEILVASSLDAFSEWLNSQSSTTLHHLGSQQHYVASFRMLFSLFGEHLCVQSARQDTFRCGVRRHCSASFLLSAWRPVCVCVHHSLITCKLIRALFVVVENSVLPREKYVHQSCCCCCWHSSTIHRRMRSWKGDNLGPTNRFRLILDCNLPADRMKEWRLSDWLSACVQVCDSGGKHDIKWSRFYFFSFSTKVKVESAKRHTRRVQEHYCRLFLLFLFINENMKYAKVSLISLWLLLLLLLFPIPLEVSALASSLINNKLFKKQNSFFSCHCVVCAVQFK